MKLNHINLVVTNVSESIKFFETYFGFKCATIKGDNIVAVLKGVDDFTLVIMSSNNKAENTVYPEGFHIGFMLENSEQVNETYLKLKNGGIAIKHEPGKIRNSFGFYFHFDKIMIEVGYYLN